MGQRFYFKNGGDVADVDDEEDVKEANILLNEGNMLSGDGDLTYSFREVSLKERENSGQCPK